MPESLGPHLLGRLPFVEDERDYRLENFMGFNKSAAAIDPAGSASMFIDAAVAELQKTTVSYKKWAATVYVDPTTTHWWKALDNLAAAKQVLTPTPPPPSGAVSWDNPRATLDQGDYGTCVGNGEAQFSNTSPINGSFTQGFGQSATNKGPYARAIYYEATVLDGSPDNPDSPGGGQQGATVRSGMQAMKNRGRINSYAMTTSLNTISEWVLTKGPMVVGTDWYEDMFYPNNDYEVTATGQYAGGHCYLLLGYNPYTDMYEFLNSWGASWGDNGHFYMHSTEFQHLLASDGETYSALELAF